MRKPVEVCKATIPRRIMRRGRMVEVERLVYTLDIPVGYKMFVNGLVGETVDDLAYVKELEDGHFLVEFEEDAIVTVEGLYENMKTCINMRFARRHLAPWNELKDFYTDRQIFHSRPCKWPGYRQVLAALFERGDMPVKIPGGLRYARAYCGIETIIPAPPRRDSEEYSKIKSVYDVRYCYILPVEEIDSLLASLPSNRGSTYPRPNYSSRQ